MQCKEGIKDKGTVEMIVDVVVLCDRRTRDDGPCLPLLSLETKMLLLLFRDCELFPRVRRHKIQILVAYMTSCVRHNASPKPFW